MRERLCNARTRSGGRCRRPAMPDHWRCRLHGGLAGRPKGIAAHPNTIAALRRGRQRWLEQMRLAKAAGRIDKIPGGRKPRGAPHHNADKTIVRAQRLIEGMMMAKKSMLFEAPGDKPLTIPTKSWDQMSKADRLSAATDLGLGIVKEILELGVDPSDVKLLAQVKDTALTIISQQIKVDETRMRSSQSAVGTYDDMFRRLEVTEASPKPIEEILREIASENNEK
jgi:hypothetical protein